MDRCCSLYFLSALIVCNQTALLVSASTEFSTGTSDAAPQRIVPYLWERKLFIFNYMTDSWSSLGQPCWRHVSRSRTLRHTGMLLRLRSEKAISTPDSPVAAILPMHEIVSQPLRGDVLRLQHPECNVDTTCDLPVCDVLQVSPSGNDSSGAC